MDASIFKKMKVKEGYRGHIMYPPEGYNPNAPEIKFEESGTEFDFILLFGESRQQFIDRIDKAKELLKTGELLWLAYPKSIGKIKYDVNRDNLWEGAKPFNLRPVSQVAIDNKWSALRFMPQE